MHGKPPVIITRKNLIPILQSLIAAFTVVWVLWESSRGAVNVRGIYRFLQGSLISAFVLLALEFLGRAIVDTEEKAP